MANENGNEQILTGDHFQENSFPDTSHSQVGGEESDAAVLQWMVDRAKKAGVDVK